MAGNNLIQFLRGTSAERATHSEVSLIGQPIFETDTNRLYVGDGTTAVNALLPVNSSSNYWDAAEQGFITPSIGETKTIKIGGTAYKIQCIGINHDDLVSGGKAKTTWQLVDCYSKRNMNSTDTHAGGWEDCEMRSWLNGTVLSTITDEDGNNLSSKIKQVVKLNANGGSQSGTAVVATNDYLFLPSAFEVFGTVYNNNSYFRYTQVAEGIQYEFYSKAPIPEPASEPGQFTPWKENSSTGTFYVADVSVGGWVDKYGEVNGITSYRRYNYNSIKGTTGGTSSTPWWLRSMLSGQASRFCNVTDGGFLDSNYANSTEGVAFCFCI